MTPAMEEFDENIIIGDLKLIQKLNNWTPTMAGGYEITLRNFTDIDLIATKVYDKMDYDLGLEKISDKYLAIFDWLDLLDQNVLIFLSLILIVACFNMISSILILIMERTQMIGVLKALGANNRTISQIFFYNGLYLVGLGLVIGNAVALIFCAIQYYFEIIPLDSQNYYMNTVPIYWAWDLFGYINLLIFTIMTITLFVPTFVHYKNKYYQSY